MTTKVRKFRALVQQGHKGCAVEVPFEPIAAWGELPTEPVYQRVRGVPVRGKAGAASFESWIIFRWKKHFLLLAEEVLNAAGVRAGEELQRAVQPR